ncbi:MAG: sulfite exporter TauE/SafE family protein [Peptococcaceae bacterium]|jgi:sulfite exporter TauE/SafE/copper chaperone CopZ|nr:sulfite exporter TauE/SafE family protein [Peptococcaceae bacterium]
MKPKIGRVTLRIGGMTCVGCQRRIERALLRTPGVTAAKVSYGAGVAEVEFDPDQASEDSVKAAINGAGYTASARETGANARSAKPNAQSAKPNAQGARPNTQGARPNTRGARPNTQSARPNAQATNTVAGSLLLIASLYILLYRFGILSLLTPSRLAEAGMGLGMLFVVGLLTSVHCVAMCGGINLSQCVPRGGESGHLSAALGPTFLYNLGRVIAYTAVGFLVGGLGAVFTFSTAAQGALKLIAGAFMIIMGVNMLGLFPWLRRLTPRLPGLLTRAIDTEKATSKGPLIVGLLNGLMPCGPLQAMQIYALSAGSPLAGALAMLFFSLGTVPLMFGLGALSTILSQKFTHKVMTAGASLVVVLGLTMLSQGWSLSGLTLPTFLPGYITAAPDTAASQAALAPIELVDGTQLVNSTLQSGRYPAITVQTGAPVKWVIDAPQGSINGCNNAMYIPAYDIEHRFSTGENVIEFTPDQPGQFRYSCWMGMIRGTITVVEPLPLSN